MTGTELLITVGSIAITWFVLRWLVGVMKLTLGTALKVAAVVLLLQLVFGIGPERLWEYWRQLWSSITSQ
ncbi:hypothetical protein L5220_06340 [Synechococcus sp. PCC 6716]|nr:hypothetical protein [Synechococcus sp. PCC 6716]